MDEWSGSIAAAWRLVSTARISLFFETNSLLLIAGNLSLWQRKSRGILDLIATVEPHIGKFPCIFPIDQGNTRRDEFAPDCPHRHRVCWCGDFPRTPANNLRKHRNSAGAWLLGLGQPGPETAGSGSRKRRHARLSLLPSWAVPIRLRFAPAKAGLSRETL